MTRPVLFTGDIFRVQPRGGITRYFLELIPRLEREAWVVAGIHQSQGLGQSGIRCSSSVQVPEFKGSPRLRALVNRMVDGFLITGRHGVVIHPTYYRDPRSVPAREPVVVTVFDMIHERFPLMFRRRWWNSDDPARFKAALCARAQRIVCISEATRADLVELLKIPAEKIRVIHCGAPEWSGVRPEPIAGMKSPFFLWVGERHGYKNFAATLKAWAACHEASPTRLLCVGGGPWRMSERAAIDALRVSGRVIQMTCSEGELRWAYEQAAALLYTSLWEGFGLPLLEAMGLGCPVIAANRAAIPEVAGPTVFYVDPTDMDSLRAGIAQCLTAGRDPARAVEGRKRAAEFTWEACAAAHENLYRELD